MKVKLIHYTMFAMICGLTLSVIIHKKRKKQRMKNIKENNLIPTVLESELQDTAEHISLMNNHNNLTIPQLPSPRWIKVGKVANLHAYPLVSGKPYNVNECQVKFEGMYMIKNGQLINWDRAFVVYNAKTKCIITNNILPILHDVDLSIKDNYIILQTAKMPTLSIKLKDNEIVECTYWYDEKMRPFPKIVCTDCGDDAAQWLSKFLYGKNVGLRLGYAINAIGCMGIYWQLIVRNCLLYEKVKQNNHSLKPFLDVLHNILISPIPYNNVSKILGTFETDEAIYPNIVVLSSNFYIEKKWEWIKIGNVIIKNTQPLLEPRISQYPIISNMKLFGLGVNCELYIRGRIKLDDNVYLHIPYDDPIMENKTLIKK